MGYKGKVRLKKRWIFTLVFLSMGVLLIATHSLYLSALGKFLVVSDPLAKVDALVVLDGDYPEHERLLHAVQLWQQGYAPRIILSAKLADWQTYEDYPAWRHAMKLNMLPADALFVVGHNADSTKEEAHKLLPFMQEHGIKQIIVVTSNYHTRRAKKVFKEVWADSDVQFSITAADSPKFHPAEWWKRRTDSRMFFYEFSKTVWYGIAE